MSCISSDLIGPGNTLFPGSLFPVMRKALYIQCTTTGAATLPFPFPFSQRLIRLMKGGAGGKKKKNQTKTVEQAN